MPHIYVATQVTALVAELEAHFKVTAERDRSYDSLHARLGLASQGLVQRPDGFILASDVSLNHSRGSALAAAEQVQAVAGIGQRPIVVVDMRQTTGEIAAYEPSSQKLTVVSDLTEIQRVLATGSIIVVPNTRDLLTHLGQVLCLEERVAPGVLLIVFSIKGGVGKTSTSSGLAAAIKHLLPAANVVVVDFDFQDGDMRQAAGLARDTADIASLARHTGALTDEIVLQHVSRHEATGVDIVPAPPETTFVTTSSREWMDLLQVFRHPYDFVICDLDTTVHDLNLDLVRQGFQDVAMLIGVVTPAIFDREGGRRLRDVLMQTPEASEDPDLLQRRVGIVINKYDPRMSRYYGDEKAVIADMAAELQLPILGLVPRDSEIEIVQFHGELYPRGRNSPAWKAMLKVAQQVIDRVMAESEARNRNLWRSR